MEIRTSPAANAAAQAVVGKANGRGVPNLPNSAPETEPPALAPRRSAYGLPCAKCGMYYEAELPACPICKSPDRVSARSVVELPLMPAGLMPAGQISPTQSLPQDALGGTPDAAVLEEERERFLRELKTQLYQTPMRIHSGDATCVLESGHMDAPGEAEICRACYEQLQQCADRMEAALHMDLKEAAKIVYEAVWADTSDPDRTYLNAAHSLLSELRSRAGISATPGAPQKYSH
jgi:hypothetical protein